MEHRPIYRVAAAGLDARDVRLVEIVFRHSQYNRYAFVLAPADDPQGCDIVIVNPIEPEGLQAVARLRAAGRAVPVVAAVPRGAPSSARHAISLDRLTLQLLPILNRVVELELGGAAAANAPASSAPGAGAGAGGSASRPAQAAGPEASPSAASPSPDAAASAASPAARAAGAQEASAAPRAQPASNLVAFPLSPDALAPRVKVLVVDDSPTVRQQLSLALNRMGLHCEAVASAAEALERLEDAHYDLVMVDVVMPGMDGYRLSREIRRRRRGTPVVMLTSRSSPFDLARGVLAGCSAYLVKPVPLRALEAAVLKQLRKSLAIDDLSGLLRAGAPAQGGAEQGAAGRSVPGPRGASPGDGG